MAFCEKCGMQLPENETVCSVCGGNATASQQQAAPQQTYTAPVYNNASAGFDPNDVAKNKGIAVLSYIGFLFFIPLVAAPQSAFARFHANQGFVLFIGEIIYGVLISILSIFMPSFILAILNLLTIAFTVFAILGIVNAASGKATELPIIGSIKILK